MYFAAIKGSNEEIKNNHMNGLKILDQIKENLKDEREFLSSFSTVLMNEMKEFESTSNYQISYNLQKKRI